MPTVTGAAHDRRCYNCGRHHDRRRRYDYDRSVRSTSTIRPTVKAWATAALGIGVMGGDE